MNNWESQPGQENGARGDSRRAAPTVVSHQPPGFNGVLAGQIAPGWGGREVEEQEGGVEGEGGGEDEGGERVTLRKQTEGEEPTSAWKNFALTLIDLQFIQFKPKAIQM